MKLLVLTGMYPTFGDPSYGRFVFEQVRALERFATGIDCDVLFFNGRYSKLNYLRAAIELRERLRLGRHDLIHAHYGLAGLVAACQASVPTILTLHGSDVHVRWQRALTRAAIRRARAIVAVSNRVKEMVRGRARDRIAVIPCGIDLELFRPIPRQEASRTLGWNEEGPRILFPASPSRPVKGHGLFRKTLAMIRREIPGATPVLLDGIPHERVPLVMNACDLMLMTSRSEGSPMAVKEAMACNLPIVSVDVGDVRELIEGIAGCVIAPRDERELARSSVRMIHEGARGGSRDRVAHLSHDRIARRLVRIYDRTVH